MRVYTNVLTSRDIYAATAAAGMHGVYADVSEHGSRTHERAFEVTLSGNGTARNSGRYGADSREQAATWDEWGMFFAALYEVDPDAVWGSVKHPTYKDSEHFHDVTGDRFRTLRWKDQHKRHIWDITVPRVQQCRKCTAMRRWDI